MGRGHSGSLDYTLNLKVRSELKDKFLRIRLKLVRNGVVRGDVGVHLDRRFSRQERKSL